MTTPHPLTGQQVTITIARAGDRIGNTNARLAADVTYTGALRSVDDDGGAHINCPDIAGPDLYVWPVLNIERSEP